MATSAYTISISKIPPRAWTLPITGIPALLDQSMVQNSIVTLDTMECQTAIAQKILDRGGDYLLALKGNHRQAHQAVAEYWLYCINASCALSRSSL